MSKEITNARIESTSLGFERGVLTYDLILDYGGSGQGFGGFVLGGSYTDKTITGILKAVGVEKWEDLKGKYVRVERMEGWNGKITAIGNIVDDVWFRP